MLKLAHLTYGIGDLSLFENASLTLTAPFKTGLVGPNGTGKSTLFRIITGQITPQGGEIFLSKNWRIGSVNQEAPGGAISVLERVLAADTERCLLLEELAHTTDPLRTAALHERLTQIDAYSAEARAAQILCGLGFRQDTLTQACASFSGGWRMRIALASVLFARPDLLLLDEPSNYLDLEGTLWLERYLNRTTCSFILISHDRHLLTTTTTSTIHLEARQLTLYHGNYESFQRQWKEKRILERKLQSKQEAQRAHITSFIHRFRAKASKARQAQSRLKLLEKMHAIVPLPDENRPPITFPNPSKKLGSPLIRLEGCTLGYPDKPLLTQVTCTLNEDSRVALLGRNGQGKSTFAKTLAGRLSPCAGQRILAKNLNISYFAQHQKEDLIPDASAVMHVRSLCKGDTETQCRARVARFGLSTSRMDTPAAQLSGGEKARLLLGLAACTGPHLLILDEPTNHLDMESRESLITALNAFEGAVLLISHDRHLIESCADELWYIAAGGLQSFEGDLADYESFLLKEPKEKGKSLDSALGPSAVSSQQERRREAAARRQVLAPLRQKLAVLEKEIENVQAALTQIDTEMAHPDFLKNTPGTMAEKAQQRALLHAQCEQMEAEWLEIGMSYEESVYPKET